MITIHNWFLIKTKKLFLPSYLDLFFFKFNSLNIVYVVAYNIFYNIYSGLLIVVLRIWNKISNIEITLCTIYNFLFYYEKIFAAWIIESLV